jgi:co-chaperonin GroES (HSP10)
MLKPRNTLVLVRLILKPEEKCGEIIIKTDKEQFAEAEVVAVGPDTISASGGESALRDLKPGQRVLVQHKVAMKQMGQGGIEQVRGYKENGLHIKENLAGERDLYLFEQHTVMMILSEPTEDTKETK